MPLGHVINDSQLLSGVRKDAGDISIMETPLQAQGLDSGGEIAPIMSDFSIGQTPTPATNNGWIETSFRGFADMQPLDKKEFKSFKAPTVAQFPRVY